MALPKFLMIILVFTSSLYGQKANNKNLSNVNLEYAHFINLATSSDSKSHDISIKYLNKTWKSSYSIMVLELLYFSKNYALQFKLLNLLTKGTGRDLRLDFNAWYEYLWNQEQQLTPYYHRFKAVLHGGIDERFSKYFLDRQEQSLIRFDEIRWGGVVQDGIPPLRNPRMIEATSANYLEDDHIVFGIEVNGDFRAYPKRILAWHELFTDTVGGTPVAGVYCTLCGTVILYKTEHNGVRYNLGTSGFLYRSNKLMYDTKTQSLWNTIWGKPVVGPLINKGIELEYLSVVTTTWKEWKLRHPNTKVLDINTGFSRDYNEGIAYKNYFATDELMFNVPSVKRKLKNKQSILAIRFDDYSDKPLAISTKFLSKNPLYQDAFEKHKFVVLTDASGANRVYEVGDVQFKEYDQATKISDTYGNIWTLYEDRLENINGKRLERIHTFNAFWFGWQAAYPNTKLIK